MENYFFSENKEGENPQKLKKVKGGKMTNGKWKTKLGKFCKKVRRREAKDVDVRVG